MESSTRSTSLRWRFWLANLWNRFVRFQPMVFGTYGVMVDLGSGFGYHAKWLRQNATYLVGVDVFRPSLDIAKTKGIFDDLVVADVLQLPFRQEKLDCVTLIDVIEHLPKKEGSELLGMLEPSAFVSTPNSRVSNRHYAKLLGNMSELHISAWSTRDFEELGYKAGTRNPAWWMRLLGNKGTVFAWRLRPSGNKQVVK